MLARLGDGARYLVDLGAGDVYRLDATPQQRLRAAAMPDPAPAPPGFALEQWSEGPLVAGNGSTYHVVIIDERICAEVLASPWMGPFTAPLVRAIELLQRIAPQLAPRPHEPCGKVGFAIYAGDGFPLMAAFKGEPLFEVTLLRFDHRPPDVASRCPRRQGTAGRRRRADHPAGKARRSDACDGDAAVRSGGQWAGHRVSLFEPAPAVRTPG